MEDDEHSSGCNQHGNIYPRKTLVMDGSEIEFCFQSERRCFELESIYSLDPRGRYTVSLISILSYH